MIYYLCLLIVVVGANELDKPNYPVLSEELINYVNNKPGNTWKAKHYPRFRTANDVKKLLGTFMEPEHLKNSRRPTVTHTEANFELPKQFSAIEHWPECKTIAQIRDQSSCGSCWAFGAVTAMSDRLCIGSKGKLNDVQISARDLMSCCRTCGFGCVGGWVGPTWDYWRDVGLVTGGLYGTNDTCLPYPFKPCDHHSKHGELGPCPKNLYPTPACTNQCIAEYTKHTYAEDKIKASSSYNVMNDAKAIQKEIFINGPVEAAFNVYADFANYEGGIYVHTGGELLGGHAVRIIGWGEDDGVPYWLVANSWNVGWGEEGRFRILRGVNHVGIEGQVAAGKVFTD